MALLNRRKRTPMVRDDFGGGMDGSLAIVDTADQRGVHTTSARVAASLRYLVARVRIHDAEEFPACLALTAALKGEGVTYVARSLASVIAYDTARSVVVVDLNWAAPAGTGRRRRRSIRAGGNTAPAAAPPTAFRAGEAIAGEPALRRGVGGPSPVAEPVVDGDTAQGDVADVEFDGGELDVEMVVEDDEAAVLDEADEPTGDDGDADEDEDDEDDDEEPAEGTDEADVVAPRQSLIDVINGTARLDDVIRATSNPRLSLIQPGVAPYAHRPGLAGDARLRAIVEELRDRFDHVLLDLPPVLASSEAIILAELADAFVLVVRQGVTSEQHVAAALEELQGSDALGVVLNRVDSSVPKPLRRLLGV